MQVMTTREVVVWCRKGIDYNSIVFDERGIDVVVWCRKGIDYNYPACTQHLLHVVVWCRKGIDYNNVDYLSSDAVLWFDVEKE